MKVNNPNNLPTIPITDLLPTQGDLKDLSDENYKKLKLTIERRGFSVPVYVWEDDNGIKHLLDGHQRRRVLEQEGWNDPIPYLKIPAANLQEAMARLLEITSQYGTITQEGIDEFIAKYELPEAEIFASTSFDALTYYEESDEEEIEDSPYTGKIEAPIYSITGEKPPISELYDSSKTLELLADIESSNAPEDVKEFLKAAAYRHTVINYANVAEYYAQADKKVQELIENSALVIIDYHKAIENGFIKLSEEVAESFTNETS